MSSSARAHCAQRPRPVAGVDRRRGACPRSSARPGSPRDDVLQAAERRRPLGGGLGRAEAIVGVDLTPHQLQDSLTAGKVTPRQDGVASRPCPTPPTITVLEGDETGQELLEQALRVLDPDVLGLPLELDRFDLSLEHRRATEQRRRRRGRAGDVPLGPRHQGRHGHARGQGRRRLAEPPAARGDRRQGHHPHRPAHPRRHAPARRRPYPISVVRMAVGDAYGAKQWREGDEGRATRSRCAPSASPARRLPRHRRVRLPHRRQMGAKVYGGPKWTVSPVYEGMLKEEIDAAAERHPDVPYQPTLIDATYAGLISGVADMPLVIPALNRDGDCLSDLVMPMFGSIAGAESVLLAFDEDYEVDVAMAEAPHGTAPALLGKDVANPMAMILACGAVLHYAGRRGPRAPSRPRARSTSPCSRRPPTASARRTSAGTPARPSSPTTSSAGCGRSSRSGRRWARRASASPALWPTGAGRALAFRCLIRRRR